MRNKHSEASTEAIRQSVYELINEIKQAFILRRSNGIFSDEEAYLSRHYELSMFARSHMDEEQLSRDTMMLFPTVPVAMLDRKCMDVALMMTIKDMFRIAAEMTYEGAEPVSVSVANVTIVIAPGCPVKAYSIGNGDFLNFLFSKSAV